MSAPVVAGHADESALVAEARRRESEGKMTNGSTPEAAASSSAAVPIGVNLAPHLKPRQRAPGELAALAVSAGVPRRIVSRAAAGQPINASAYLKICSAIGLDPVTGKECPSVIHWGDIQWWFFACGLKVTRMLRKLSIRDVVLLTGVSGATISRTEAGRPISAENYLALCAFIGVHPHHYAHRFTGNNQCNSLKTLAVAAE
jgi:hypothetical protein